MSDSWDLFAKALGEESDALRARGERAQALSKALVHLDAEQISVAQRALDDARESFSRAASERRAMQVRGFGTMTLRQVCSYAPRSLAWEMNQRLAELMTTSIGVTITNNNNKALIAGGMDRLVKTTLAMQRAASEPSTYRRRGFVAPPSNSVLLSSKA